MGDYRATLAAGSPSSAGSPSAIHATAGMLESPRDMGIETGAGIFGGVEKPPTVTETNGSMREAHQSFSGFGGHVMRF